MVVLDHSYSMSAANMTNSKNATLSMFQNFDYHYQSVGLGVTPPVQPGNPCQSIKYWSDANTWVPAPLTAAYETAPHVLDNSSPPVSDTNCLDITNWPGGYLQYTPGHTNLGDPLKAAKQELVAHGRANATWGLILITDGAANVAPTSSTVSASTGQKFCTSQAAVTANSGDNNGYETSPSNICANDSNMASDVSSGTGTQTTCTDTHKDRHILSNFGAGAAIPASPAPTIDGIEIRLDAGLSTYSAFTTRQICVELSWNNGTNWTAAKQVTLTQTTENTYILGSSADNWGHAWTTSDLSDANFKVRVTDVAPDTTTTFKLDDVAANAYYHYTDATLANKGPCDWAGPQATAAKALGIVIYTIAFGATDSCDSSNGGSSSSAYNNMSSVNFLKSLATDAAHFYNTPKTTDLTAIFTAIGSQLTSGSRLVSCTGC
jgi:hypothetical protein